MGRALAGAVQQLVWRPDTHQFEAVGLRVLGLPALEHEPWEGRGAAGVADSAKDKETSLMQEEGLAQDDARLLDGEKLPERLVSNEGKGMAMTILGLMPVSTSQPEGRLLA